MSGFICVLGKPVNSPRFSWRDRCSRAGARPAVFKTVPKRARQNHLMRAMYSFNRRWDDLTNKSSLSIILEISFMNPALMVVATTVIVTTCGSVFN
mgnify:CR=1 FL=1